MEAGRDVLDVDVGTPLKVTLTLVEDVVGVEKDEEDVEALEGSDV